MVYYVPGTEETDLKKVIMSLQQTAGVAATNTTNITTNTANITLLQTAGQGLVNSGGSLAVSLSKITASLGADVALNNTGTYFTGPSVAQGTTGTWFASGTVTLTDTAGGAAFYCQLSDGTTIIDSAAVNSGGATGLATVSLSGYITSPANNLRISVKDITSTSGKILFNQTGTSKDSTITAIRIA